MTELKCERNENRAFNDNKEEFMEIRKIVENHIKKNYMRAIQAPTGKKIKLVTWMQMI